MSIRSCLALEGAVLCSGEQREQGCAVLASYVQVKPTSASSILERGSKRELPGYKSTSFLTVEKQPVSIR